MRCSLTLKFFCCLGAAHMALAAEEKPCTIHNDGKYYDLNPLKARKDYELKSLGGHEIVLNVCRAVAHETWGLKTEDPSEVAAFIRKDHGDLSMGKVNTTLGIKDSNLQLIYGDGSVCKSTDGLRATTTIEFICDTSVFSAGTPRLVAQFPTDDETACGFHIEWKTHFACPTGERGPWGFFAVLAVLALILVMLYLVVGTLHNRYVLGLQGFDQIPQFSFASMSYHARHAIDWLREAIVTGSLQAPISHGPNPVSHQSTVPGMPAPQHPQPNTRRGRSVPETNPVSHQTQVGLGSSAGLNPIKSQSPPRQQRRRFDLESGGSQEERERMLADEDDASGQELAEVPKKTEKPAPTLSSAVGEESDVAEARGRGMDSDGVIRL